MNIKNFLLGLFTLGSFVIAAMVPVSGALSDPPQDIAPVVYFAYLSNDDIRIDSVELPPGQTQVIPGNNEGVLAWPILPPSFGRSAALADPKDEGFWVVRRVDMEISLEFRRSNGETSGWKTPVGMLVNSTIRVSVTGLEHQAAFEIIGYREVRPSGGPVLNSLSVAGFPHTGQYVVETDTAEYKRSTKLIGEAQFRGGILPIVDLYVDGQKVGSAIVDTGGATTLINRSLVTADMVVKEWEGPKVSGGRQNETLSKGPMGAGGEVEAMFGTTVLQEVSVGNIQFGEMDVLVTDGLQELFEPLLGEPIVAVLGLDQLAKADTITFEFNGEAGWLRLGEKLSSPEGLPFTLAAGHIYVPSKASGKTVSLLLDTGARPNLLFLSKAAEILGITSDPDRQAIEGFGVDGAAVSLVPSILSVFQIGHRYETDLPVIVSNLPALATRQSSDGLTGLLGFGYLKSFSSVTIDMINKQLVLKD